MRKDKASKIFSGTKTCEGKSPAFTRGQSDPDLAIQFITGHFFLYRYVFLHYPITSLMLWQQVDRLLGNLSHSTPVIVKMVVFKPEVFIFP